MRLRLVLLLAAVLLLTGVSTAAADVRVAFLQGEQVVYLARPGTTPEDAVRALLAGPTAAEQADQVTTTVPKNTRLLGLTVVDGVATVDLGPKFANGKKAELLQARIAQLVLTMTRQTGVTSVQLLLGGGTPLGLFPGYATKFPITKADVTGPEVPPPPTAPPPEPKPDESVQVRALQQRLADLSYLPPEAVDGVAGDQTRFAVMAFQKWAGLGRDGVAGPKTKEALATASRPTPRTRGSGRRVEVLLDRQVTLSIESGRVVRTLSVSSGAPGFETPTGSFKVFRKEQNSWSVPYKVWLPWASYFVGGVAFHQSPDVPAGPASHGCVRVPVYDAKWLYDRLPNGTVVTVLGRS